MNQLEILGLAHTFVIASPSNVQGQTSMDARKIFTVAREVLHNNYQSHNFIGPYHFWGISPSNSTLFTRPFLTGGAHGLGTRLGLKVFRLIKSEHSMTAKQFTMPSNISCSGG